MFEKTLIISGVLKKNVKQFFKQFEESSETQDVLFLNEFERILGGFYSLFVFERVQKNIGGH